MQLLNFPVSAMHLAAGLLAGSALIAAPAGAATFVDAGAFDPSTWSMTVHGHGSVGDTRLASGGNPGDFLSLQTVPGGGVIVIGFLVNSAAAWDPATLGAIATVDMDLDVKMLASAFGHGDGQAYGIALSQDGLFFQSGYKTIGFPRPEWDSRTVPSVDAIAGITGPGFRRVNGDGTTDPLAHPDFSASGSPISFGLVVANSGGHPISGTTAGYDNWGLTVTPVPEPATFGLFGLGLAGLGWLALRRRGH